MSLELVRDEAVGNSAAIAESGVTSTLPSVLAFVYRLIGPRPTFAFDMSAEERETMAQHACRRRESGHDMRLQVFVAEPTGAIVPRWPDCAVGRWGWLASRAGAEVAIDGFGGRL